MSSNILNWINYKEQAAFTKKLLKNKKRDSIKKYAAEISYRMSLTYFWNAIKILKNKWTDISNDKYLDPKKISNNIQSAINKVYPPWVLIDPTLNLLLVSTKDFLDAPFDFR